MIEKNKNNNNEILSKQKSIISDIPNIKTDNEQLKTTKNSKIKTNNFFFINNSPKSINILSKIINQSKNNSSINKNSENSKINNNINLKAEEEKQKNSSNLIKIKKISKNKTISNINLIYKSKTQTDFYLSKNLYNNSGNIRNLPNISNVSNSNINNEKKMNKTNSFYFNNSQMSKNNIIYFNSSINEFYNKNNMFNINSPLEIMNQNKHTLFIPKSNSIGFISKILKSYRKKQKIKNSILNTKSKDKNIKTDILEDNNNKDNKLFKGLGLFLMNKSVIKTLFRKTPIKIKSGVITCLSEDKIKSDIFLNPFSNSYGCLLDDLSEKIGFMKGSMNMIYPKISQSQYKINEIERTKKIIEMNKNIKKKKYNHHRNKSLDSNNRLMKSNIKLFNTIKPKKIIKKFFTKYPINIPKKGEKAFSSKMYSLKRQQKFIENE